MRFKIEVDLQGVSLKLPLNYQEVIQGILYHSLPEEVANDAHRQEKGVRKMPLFTFSSLRGTYAINREQGAIYFDSLYFFVSCLDDSLGFSLVTNLFKGITIFGHQFPCQITSLSDYGGGNWIEFLSPVTVRKTNLDTKKTTYFEPNTMEFTSAIYQNLKRKYQYYYGAEYEGPFALSAVPESVKKSIITYKGTNIRAYSGRFHLVASPEAMALLYNIGLGEKNAQGFGMFQMLDDL